MTTGSWAAGWAAGEFVPFSEMNKGMAMIANDLKSSAGANFDFTSIVATYGHLRVILYARGDTAATSTAVALRFNNDSGSNYDAQRGVLTGAAGTWTSAEDIAATSCTFTVVPASTAPADSYGMFSFDIPHYAGTADHKVLSGTGSAKIGTTTGNFQLRLGSGWWRSTSAINRITLLPAAGNFDAGSRCSIYVYGD